MEYDDRYTPLVSNDYDNQNQLQESALKKAQVLYRGYHRILRNVSNSNRIAKNVEIGVYGSGSQECPIRNAETGEYYKFKVGTMDEDLFFKVGLSTGECSSKNKSSTLFYLSPNHYMSHMQCELDEEFIARWETKRNDRTAEINSSSNSMASVVVN